jgi:hypothetical protein
MGCSLPQPARSPAESAGEVASWPVFESAAVATPAGGTFNSGFSRGSSSEADGWAPFGDGYEIDREGGRGGGRALRLARAAPQPARGAVATIVLDQREARPIYLAAASKAENVSGEPDADYGLYLDLQFTDGTASHAHTLEFQTGTHDWELRDRVIVPEKPVARIFAHCLFRNRHGGVVWFDDVVVRQLPIDAVVFDAQLARPVADPAALARARSPVGTLATRDGLTIRMGQGGAVASVALAGQEVGDPERAHLGGFLLRDVRARGGWVHPAGRLREEGGGLVQSSEMAEQGLRFEARYQARDDRIEVHAQLEDTQRKPRAITLSFALPIRFSGWQWGDDIRRARPVVGAVELSNTSREWDIGAVGALSRYPWAAVWGGAGGIALGHGLTEPRVFRFAANPTTGQLYVSFDLGLSPETARFPGRAWVDFCLYRFDGAGGFRAATQGYYDRFPAFFTRRMRPQQEGTWLPFSRKARIQNIADFGFGVHELHDLEEVASDQALGITSFRYLQVPDAYTLWVDGAPAAERTAALERRVAERLRAQHESGRPLQKAQAEAIYSSAFHDERGQLIYRWAPKGQIPWCGGSAGCAVFPASADPEIADERYPTNKARADWNDEHRQLHARMKELDGEYVDGVQSSGFRFMLDQRPSHLAVSRQPVTFMGQGRVLGIPSLFATVAFLHWLEPEVHGKLGKLLMGNTVPEGLPWGADVFDYLGIESNWVQPEAGFVPEDDAIMSYRRTLSGQRPFGMLQNTDFQAMGRDGRVERFFQIALFYGFYPSFFSADAASNPYWENPALYNRDRPLFRKYVPLVRKLSGAGWQVLTRASTSDPQVYIERFGNAAPFYFTVRNTATSAVTVTVTIDPALELPAKASARRMVAGGPELPVNGGRFSLPLAAGNVEAVEIAPGGDATRLRE